MAWQSSEDAMPWVGLYIALASLVCNVAMGADVIQAFWQWKLWFPNRFFTLSATSLALIAIAIKLPTDLNSEATVPSWDLEKYKGVKDENSTVYTKVMSIIFLNTMLANFLPSLALMNGKELLSNILALGILVITIAVDMGIQLYIHVVSLSSELIIPLLIFPSICLFSIASTVSTFRKQLERRYKESQLLVSDHPDKKFSSKELRGYVKKCWMMTETRNPQFVIACSQVSVALGVLCMHLAFSSIYMVTNMHEIWNGIPVYKWSLKIIFNVQSIGVVVGSIGPIFRCFTSVGHDSLSVKWSKNNLNVFRVERHWTQQLQNWKPSPIGLHIPGRSFVLVFNKVKSTLLNFCIAIQIAVLVLSNTMCLIPRFFVVVLSWCCYFIKKSTNHVY